MKRVNSLQKNLTNSVAEYFATPNEIINLGKNCEWMEPCDERETLHGRGQASTP